MTFQSILFETPEDRKNAESATAPSFFADLNCDQVVDGITGAKGEYDLKPFFYGCLHRVGAVAYRHQIMSDLENPFLFEAVTSLGRTMKHMRATLAWVRKCAYKEEQEGWFLDAVKMYCDALVSFTDDLSRAGVKSRGFGGLLEYLRAYTGSPSFVSLVSETTALKTDLSEIRYCVRIKSGAFTVRKYEAEADYSAEIESVFEKFKQGATRDYRMTFQPRDYLNHIEAKILEFTARLHPEVFGRLGDFYLKNQDYVDEPIAKFDREIQFYIGYMDFVAPLKRVGLPFCYPEISEQANEVYSQASFDIALADKMAKGNASVVCNDFSLRGDERILVVSGPNQGGKTTFARTFGQLHYLASIGLPVPGNQARLLAFDHILTHFEKEEAVENLRGKLEDDLVRIHDILDRATPRSVIILNEVFASTTLYDETFLSIKVMERISKLDSLCVWVTFVDELASFNGKTVSMVSTVDPENPAARTFKILRRPADGLAHAMAIARKHRLTFDSIKERIGGA